VQQHYWWPAARSTDGKRLWGYSTRTGPGANAADAGDLDGDGKEEVVVGGTDGNLHALDDNGRLLWLYHTGDEVRAVICTNLDRDERMEVVYLDGVYANMQWSGRVPVAGATLCPGRKITISARELSSLSS